MNGVKVDLPYKKDNYEIYQKSKGVECKTSLGVVVTYSRWQAKVGVPESFKGKVRFLEI